MSRLEPCGTRSIRCFSSRWLEAQAKSIACNMHIRLANAPFRKYSKRCTSRQSTWQEGMMAVLQLASAQEEEHEKSSVAWQPSPLNEGLMNVDIEVS